MADIKINKSNLKGNINIPSSKSFTHRALLCAALSKSKSVISNVSLSDDTNATIECLEKLGCKILVEDNRVYINSTDLIYQNEEEIVLNCKESATTLRLLIPVCAALGLKVKFTGEGSLINRPLSIYEEMLPLHGVQIKYEKKLPFSIIGYDEEGPGTLKNGTFEVAGNISSQFVSGLLFAFPLIKGESKLILTNELESKGYVDLSVSVLNTYAIKVNQTDYGYQVKGNQRYLSSHIHVIPDETLAALFLVANKLGANIKIDNFNSDSLNSIIDDFSLKSDNEIDARNIPDLIPILSVLACFNNGKTKIKNATRLKYKESNRILSCAEMVNSLGANAKYTDDSITIEGLGELFGGKINSYMDHRIIMAATIAGLFSNNSVIITDSECVSKSYINFFDDIKSLGGNIENV